MQADGKSTDASATVPSGRENRTVPIRLPKLRPVRVTYSSTGPFAGVRAVISGRVPASGGSKRKVRILESRPPTRTRTLPRTASATVKSGTVVWMRVSSQASAAWVPAEMSRPSKVKNRREAASWSAPKPRPPTVTPSPDLPCAGWSVQMPGRTRSFTTKSDNAGPRASFVASASPAAVVTRTAPECAPAGNVTVISRSLQAVAAHNSALTSSPSAGSPKKTTCPGRSPKPTPESVTNVPGPPSSGDTRSMRGESAHRPARHTPEAQALFVLQAPPPQAPHDPPQSIPDSSASWSPLPHDKGRTTTVTGEAWAVLLSKSTAAAPTTCSPKAARDESHIATAVKSAVGPLETAWPTTLPSTSMSKAPIPASSAART